MSSPFPGMDPYLEHIDLWGGLHHTLISNMMTTLNTILPSPYVAAVEEWLTIFPSENPIEPDVFIREKTGPAAALRGGPAVMEPGQDIIDEPILVEADAASVRIPYINILHTKDESHVVTTIEVLSPTNKTPGKDQDAYKRKQRGIYASGTHLVEIDLLRAGAYTVAVPWEFLGERKWDYIVSLHRGLSGPKFEVWPGTVRERLPRIYVPLDESQPRIPLDLQRLFEKSYDAGAFGWRVDYQKEPEPPLSKQDAAWADSLLRGKRLANRITHFFSLIFRFAPRGGGVTRKAKEAHQCPAHFPA